MLQPVCSVGIVLSLSKTTNRPVVVGVSGRESTIIGIGDTLTHINSRPMYGSSLKCVQEMLNGPMGSLCDLTFVGNNGRSYDVTLPRTSKVQVATQLNTALADLERATAKLSEERNNHAMMESEASYLEANVRRLSDIATATQQAAQQAQDRLRSQMNDINRKAMLLESSRSPNRNNDDPEELKKALNAMRLEKEKKELELKQLHKQSLEIVQQQQQQLSARTHEYYNVVQSLQYQLKKMEAAIAEEREARKSAVEASQRLHQQLAQLRQSNTLLSKEKNELEETVVILESEVRRIGNALQQYAQRTSEAENLLDDSLRNEKLLRQQLAIVMEEKAASRTENNTLQSKLEQLEHYLHARIGNLQWSEIQQLHEKLQYLHEENKRLRRCLASTEDEARNLERIVAILRQERDEAIYLNQELMANMKFNPYEVKTYPAFHRY